MFSQQQNTHKIHKKAATWTRGERIKGKGMCQQLIREEPKGLSDCLSRG